MKYIESSTIERLDDWRLIGSSAPQFAEQYMSVNQTLHSKLSDLVRFSEKIKQNKEKVDKYNTSLFDKFNKMIASMSKQLSLDDTADNWLVNISTVDNPYIHVL